MGFEPDGLPSPNRATNSRRIHLRRRKNPILGFSLLAGESAGFTCGVAKTRSSGFRS